MPLEPEQYGSSSPQDRPLEEPINWDAVLPAPGPVARAVFRCVLVASITVLCAIPIALLLSVFSLNGDQLARSASSIAMILAIPTFALSFTFLRSEPRLGLIGVGVLILLVLFALGMPEISDN